MSTRNRKYYFVNFMYIKARSQINFKLKMSLKRNIKIIRKTWEQKGPINNITVDLTIIHGYFYIDKSVFTEGLFLAL